MTLSDEAQDRRRQWFRRHGERGVAFNRQVPGATLRTGRSAARCSLCRAPERPSRDLPHGGVVSALIDTAGCGAVLAGHDLNKASRVSTVSTAIQYLATAPGEDVVAYATCTRRASTVHCADVTVRSESGNHVTVSLTSTGTLNVWGGGTRTCGGHLWR